MSTYWSVELKILNEIYERNKNTSYTQFLKIGVSANSTLQLYTNYISFKRFLQKGTVKECSHSGRPKKFTEDQKSQIYEILTVKNSLNSIRKN